MKVNSKITVCFILLMAMACKQEYPLPKETQNLNLLVVEGLLNSGTGPTVIRLSRTFDPTRVGVVIPELRAQVTVEGENNTTFPLTGNTRGEYINNQLNLNSNVKYRLRIKTTGGKEYLSDYVPVQIAPSIDSVHWKRTDEGIQLLVSTHDPQNKTWYYRWEYDETWEIHSNFISNYRWQDPQVVNRQDPFAIYFCWVSDISRRIFVNSSAKLSQDVISSQQLNLIPLAAERISVRYSILVTQYALTQDAYKFWEIMKKNTEQVGTLFDPQPSQLLSNIHSVNDPTEPVIGFVSAGAVSQKRLFIRRNEVEPWRYRLECEERNIPLDSLRFFFSNDQWIPLQEWYGPSGRLSGYASGRRICVDCTVRGTNVKPAFW
jgi:hypothetical protein